MKSYGMKVRRYTAQLIGRAPPQSDVARLYVRSRTRWDDKILGVLVRNVPTIQIEWISRSKEERTIINRSKQLLAGHIMPQPHMRIFYYFSLGLDNYT